MTFTQRAPSCARYLNALLTLAMYIVRMYFALATLMFTGTTIAVALMLTVIHMARIENV